MTRNDLRNIAIIAHVDHGKTTLVDEMLKQGGIFRENQVVRDRVMDSGALERERGITILSKNTSLFYNGVKINIIDTPGHADFGGEVERVLQMVDGVLLLVDAFEGPMPQTRFVLERALALGHTIIVVVNKVDRPDARPEEIEDEVLELLLDLDASEEQLQSTFVYCSGREGTASLDYSDLGDNLIPLFNEIIEKVPAPKGDSELPMQMLVSSIDYNEYVGRIAIGRIKQGTIKQGQEVVVTNYHGDQTPRRGKVVNLYQIDGLTRDAVDSAQFGDIVCVSGVENITIGDTICAPDAPEPLPFVKISEPTIEMTFSVNDSPFAGREGKYVTSRQLRDRLFKELLKDVSLRVSETDTTESFNVAGRGEMHLSILIETMRREGYELQVSTPRVLFHEENGKRMEPVERVTIDVPEECVGSVMEKMGTRKGQLVEMHPTGNRMRLEFLIPSRGLFGYRSEFLTDTKGEGILNTIFEGYEEYKGEIPTRQVGSLVAYETGTAVTYGLFNAQERGTLFIPAQTEVYEGMIIGSNPKAEDLVVNVCKTKHLTNTRASGSDDSLRLTPPRVMSLEESLEFISDDELVEVTPESIRLRKKILNNQQRAKITHRK
ncbi:translational GTPase TypA [bacterium 210820-DFI.6.52]|uniref:Large ribosomal subunit assembly factor BipA n=1 Tax=Bittarella massiliensis (ex Durand et al. 2017) TaxID=1720313 RepID=A0AAQ1MG07_9FIRM|nr:MULTISPECIES: translational GTPase TypA [Eubacteriales]MCB5942309.1 translational GTPase TypA [bacterium 210820-DFI.6.52]MZL70807.1 translational GTPase TypA [Bittarella massiliensis (ex Durand et al. 2017)]MZL81636.1 translational GTPase TypA [Bittarella massiliensis (ex Durand et al. 2017)]SHG65516.1 GTP-binding protein [Bittarella massiliensis (ex Durand et al. 2017)]